MTSWWGRLLELAVDEFLAGAPVTRIELTTDTRAPRGICFDSPAPSRTRCSSLRRSSPEGYTLLAVHTDAGRSGKTAANRPALQAAIKQACASGAVLVSYSLSRVARSVPDAYAISEKLTQSGAGLVLLKESMATATATLELSSGAKRTFG